MAISMAGLPAFLLYFAVGVALIAGFAVAYQRLTAHDEIALIRSGNLAAAIAFGGNLVGFAVPLEKAIAQASSIPDCVLRALAAMLIQFGAYERARPPRVMTRPRKLARRKVRSACRESSPCPTSPPPPSPVASTIS